MREVDREVERANRARWSPTAEREGSRPEAAGPRVDAPGDSRAEQAALEPGALEQAAGLLDRGILVFVAAFAVHRLLAWALDARPAALGEPLTLRWLRALAEHPIRGPLGLALAVLALRALGRAIGIPARRT